MITSVRVQPHARRASGTGTRKLLSVQLAADAQYDIDAVNVALKSAFRGYEVRVTEGLGTHVNGDSIADDDLAWQTIKNV